MRRLIGSGALVLAAVAVGCGPEKELPDLPKNTKPITSGGDPFGPPPAATDPAAKAVLDRAAKAIADGDTVRLARGRSAKVTYLAEFKLSQHNRVLTPSTSTIETVWPELAVVSHDYKGQAANKTFYLNGARGWLKDGPGLHTQTAGTTDLGHLIRNDLTAWHWLMLGLTLTDPAAIAFEPTKKGTGTAVRVALPNRSVFLVTFDEATGLPVRVECHPVELGVRVHKVFTLSDHKPFGGLVLATKIETTQEGDLVERWTAPAWEFPESIPASRFDPPKE